LMQVLAADTFCRLCCAAFCSLQSSAFCRITQLRLWQHP
jgi:hypothetical protein